MENDNYPGDARRFTLTVIISFVVVFIFCILLMLWHGSYQIKDNGEINYNTRVVEPNSSY